MFPSTMSLPDAKRARVEGESTTPTFEEVDVSQVKIIVAPAKYGATVRMEGAPPRFNFTPVEPLKLVFGFDLAGKTEKRSFNCALVKSRTTNETLGTRMALSTAQADFLNALDAQCKQQFEAAVATHGDDAVKAVWLPLVTVNEQYQNVTAKLHVVLNGDCTAIKVKGPAGVAKGTGYDFLCDQAMATKARSFARADAMMVIRATVYNFEGLAGVKLTATQIFLKPAPAEVEVDEFPDDAM
jgi:hypothetical protein